MGKTLPPTPIFTEGPENQIVILDTFVRRTNALLAEAKLAPALALSEIERTESEAALYINLSNVFGAPSWRFLFTWENTPRSGYGLKKIEQQNGKYWTPIANECAIKSEQPLENLLQEIKSVVTFNTLVGLAKTALDDVRKRHKTILINAQDGNHFKASFTPDGGLHTSLSIHKEPFIQVSSSFPQQCHPQTIRAFFDKACAHFHLSNKPREEIHITYPQNLKNNFGDFSPR